MIETQQQVQQSVYGSGIVGSAISDNINQTKALAQVQAQGSQEQSAVVPVATVQPLNSDDIALPQQNFNQVNNADYSSFFEMIASTLDSVNTNIENLSSVILNAFDTLFPNKKAKSKTTNNPFNRLKNDKDQSNQSGGGLGLLGSIAAGVGGASLLHTLSGGEEDKKEPPSPNAIETPSTTPSTPPTTPYNEPLPTSDGSKPRSITPAGRPSQTPEATSSMPNSTGVNPSNVIAGATVSAFAAEKVFKPSPTSLFGRALPMANRLLLPAAIGYEGYDRYTREQKPGEIATIIGSGLVGMLGGASGGAKLGGAAGAIFGPPGAAIGGAIGGFVGGALGYFGGEYAAENIVFSNNSTGNKLNQESVGASENNKPEVNNITLPPASSEASPSGNNPQSSNTPPVSYVPSVDYFISPNLDYAYV